MFKFISPGLLALFAALPAAAFDLKDLQPGISLEANDKIGNFERGFNVHVVKCKNARKGEDPRGLLLDKAGAWFLKLTSPNTAQAKLHPSHVMAIDASRDLIQYQGSVSKAKLYPNPNGVRQMRCKR